MKAPHGEQFQLKVGQVQQEYDILDNVAMNTNSRVQEYLENNISMNMHRKFLIYKIHNTCMQFCFNETKIWGLDAFNPKSIGVKYS